MTKNRALIKAKLLWGNAAWVQARDGGKYPNGTPVPTHRVGKWTMGIPLVLGEGKSFEEAFKSAQGNY